MIDIQFSSSIVLPHQTHGNLDVAVPAKGKRIDAQWTNAQLGRTDAQEEDICSILSGSDARMNAFCLHFPHE
jgi:hypothetical protein